MAPDSLAKSSSPKIWGQESEASAPTSTNLMLEITQRGLGKTNLYRLFLTVKKGAGRRP
jgi:hypothetical protein